MDQETRHGQIRRRGTKPKKIILFHFSFSIFNCFYAEVAELAYAQVSEACAARLVGSNPTFRTPSLSYAKASESFGAQAPFINQA